MKKILIVEDNELNMKLFYDILLYQKYSPEKAMDGLSAYNLIKNEKFDLIILDIQLPKMTGFELLEKYDEGVPVAIEMVASYGMPVGMEVFDTCVWIGRFAQAAKGHRIELIYRKEEKLCLCGSLKAKDGNICQALVDRFAPGQPNKGKGTKKEPGFFYGFSKDMWAAMAVATTYFDKYILKIKI